MKNQKAQRTQSFAITALGATSVQLVGDFTHWLQRPINLKRGAKDIWRARVTLAPGTYQYRFLVDGQWHDDPACVLRIANPFGSENMVREVKGVAQ